MTSKELLHRFSAYRKHLNRNQEDWAECCQKSRETFSRIENGHAALPLDMLLAIAKLEGVHPADFFCFDPDTQRVVYPSDAVHTREIASLKKTVDLLQARIEQLELRGGGRVKSKP